MLLHSKGLQQIEGVYAFVMCQAEQKLIPHKDHSLIVVQLRSPGFRSKSTNQGSSCRSRLMFHIKRTHARMALGSESKDKIIRAATVDGLEDILIFLQTKKYKE